MKVVQRETLGVVPGKMEEAIQLLKKHIATASRLGAPASCRRYRRFSGRGDSKYTLIVEFEWDSLAAMEAFREETAAHSEIQALRAKWETVLESNEVELYILDVTR